MDFKRVDEELPAGAWSRGLIHNDATKEGAPDSAAAGRGGKARKQPTPQERKFVTALWRLRAGGRCEGRWCLPLAVRGRGAGAREGFTRFHGWLPEEEAPPHAAPPIYHERAHLI